MTRRRNPSGEWWIDDTGQSEYADIDIGDFGHEAIAYATALGLPLGPDAFYDMHEDDRPPEFDYGERLGDDDDPLVIWLRENGTSEEAIAYFRKPHADARRYAVEFMGWIRVKDANIEVWKFDDETLHRLQNGDMWGEEDEEDEEATVYVEEVSTGRSWEFPTKRLLTAQSAEGLIRYTEGIGQWHRENPLPAGATLADIAEVRTNFPEADFWLVRKGDPAVVGKPVREFSPEHIGIAVKTPSILPTYLFYALEHLQGQGYWQERAVSATRLVNIRVDDVKRIAVRRR